MIKLEINKENLLRAKEEIIKKYMFVEEEKELKDQINLEINEILTSFENQDKEEILDE